MIEMDVQSREDGVMKIMLNIGQFIAQHADVMIVYQGDGADHLAVWRLPGLFHQFVADEIAKGFGTVGVAALGDEGVEFLEKAGIDGDTNPAEASHSYK